MAVLRATGYLSVVALFLSTAAAGKKWVGLKVMVWAGLVHCQDLLEQLY